MIRTKLRFVPALLALGLLFYSPDAVWIAYSAHLNGNTDAYVIPAAGGVPRRITWHPDGSSVTGWSPDGKDVLIDSGAASYRHFLRIFRVHADGSGVPEPLPLPSGFQGSFSPDGQSLAYQPLTKWQPAWKRYVGRQTTPSGSSTSTCSSSSVPDGRRKLPETRWGSLFSFPTLMQPANFDDQVQAKWNSKDPLRV